MQSRGDGHPVRALPEMGATGALGIHPPFGWEMGHLPESVDMTVRPQRDVEDGRTAMSCADYENDDWAITDFVPP